MPRDNPVRRVVDRVRSTLRGGQPAEPAAGARKARESREERGWSWIVVSAETVWEVSNHSTEPRALPFPKSRDCARRTGPAAPERTAVDGRRCELSVCVESHSRIQALDV